MGYSAALNLVLGWDADELRYWDPVAKERLLSHQKECAARLAAENRAARLAIETRIAELETQLHQQRGN